MNRKLIVLAALAALLLAAPGCITVVVFDKLTTTRTTGAAPPPVHRGEGVQVTSLSLVLEANRVVALHVGVGCPDGVTRHYVGRSSSPEASLEERLAWPAASAAPVHFTGQSLVMRSVASDGSIGAIESGVVPQDLPAEAFVTWSRPSDSSTRFVVTPPAGTLREGHRFEFSMETGSGREAAESHSESSAGGIIAFVLLCPLTAALDLALLPIEVPLIIIFVNALSHMGPAR